MIFYLAKHCVTRRVTVCTTQDEARPIDKGFTKVDIPVDKPGLKAVLQDFFDQLHQAEQDKGEDLSSGESEALDSRPELSPPSPQARPQPIALTPAKIGLMTRQQIEEQWDDFPLAWQLDMAARALESARSLAPRSMVSDT